MGALTGFYIGERAPELCGVVHDNMLTAVAHRGPAVFKYEEVRGLALGVRANDDTERARVFHYDKESRVTVALDGEVFHYLTDISGVDGRKGIYDAERILSLYLRYGESFPEKIDGSFSIAIFDGPQNRILLIRDRFGTKPLYYMKKDESFFWGSEIKSIVSSKYCDLQVNLASLNRMLSYGYVPNPNTMFRSIHQVKPGHTLIFEKGELSERLYWRFKYSQVGEKCDDDYIDEFREIFRTAVSRRISRHPNAGAFLSGGLDTSGVVAVMRELKGKPFKVFSAGFLEEEYNEIEDARLIADHLGLELITTIVTFEKDFPGVIEKIVWHHDAPFQDTSAIPSYYLAGLTKEYVDTVLTGDFPDQLIGGSGHQVFALCRERNDSLWRRTLRNPFLNKLACSLPLSAGSTSFVDKVKRSLYRETFCLEEQRHILGMPVPLLLKKRLYSPEMLFVEKQDNALEVARSLYSEVEGEKLLNKLLYFDIYSYASDDLMVKVDRMTCAHGLTAISPFHDLDLVEFVSTLPPDMKIRGDVRKYVEREAFRPMLPMQTLNKRKQGFAMPIGMWLSQKMPEYVHDILLDSRSLERGYFNKKFMKSMVKDFLAGRTDFASGSEAAIISLITLELWHRIFIDQ